MKLRLLLHKECEKHCAGCCNKEWDLDGLNVCTSYEGYDEILLTGGEPMLKPSQIEQVVKEIKKQNPSAKIYVYTALVDTPAIIDIYLLVDGLTVTLHELKDFGAFISFEGIRRLIFTRLERSLRLNVFKGVPTPVDIPDWRIKDNITWHKNCPIPEDELFMRVKEYK